MKKILVLLLCLGLSGCATTAGYEAILNSWVGSNESSLISTWGAPQNSYIMANGQRAIEFVRQQNMQMGGYTYTQPQTTYQSGTINTSSNINANSNFNTYGDVNVAGNINTYGNVNTSGTYSGTSTQYVTQTTPTYNILLSCRTTFILDSNGIVQNWRWEGNSCRAVMPKQQKTYTPTLPQYSNLPTASDINTYLYTSKHIEYTKTVKMSLKKVFDNDLKSKEYYSLKEIADTEIDKDKKSKLEDEIDDMVKKINSDIDNVVADYAEKNQIYDVYSMDTCSGWCEHLDDISDEIISILNTQGSRITEKINNNSIDDPELEAKIKTLNKLLADGLITKNEFDERKKEALDTYTNSKN